MHFSLFLLSYMLIKGVEHIVSTMLIKLRGWQYFGERGTNDGKGKVSVMFNFLL